MKAKNSISYLLNNIDDSSAKPLRKRIGEHQAKALRAIFESVTQFPNRYLRENLAESLGLTPRTIQVWFQNRRQNLKCNYEIENDHQTASILQSLRNTLK